MTTKEKLDLLWKYLLLAVLVFGFTQIGRNHPSRLMGPPMKMMGGHGMSWSSAPDNCDEMDVKVMVEKTGENDSTVVVTINGEVVDPADFDWKSMEPGAGKVFMHKMGKPGQKRIEITRKENSEK